VAHPAATRHIAGARDPAPAPSLSLTRNRSWCTAQYWVRSFYPYLSPHPEPFSDAKVANRTEGSARGKQKMVLERWTNPKRSRAIRVHVSSGYIVWREIGGLTRNGRVSPLKPRLGNQPAGQPPGWCHTQGTGLCRCRGVRLTRWAFFLCSRVPCSAKCPNRYLETTFRLLLSQLLKTPDLRFATFSPQWRAKDGTIAADTQSYPFGTRMFVPEWGWGVVEDRGGAIQGEARLDLYHNHHAHALQWGRTRCLVKI
jgi:hypothetical protein